MVVERKQIHANNLKTPRTLSKYNVFEYLRTDHTFYSLHPFNPSEFVLLKIKLLTISHYLLYKKFINKLNNNNYCISLALLFVNLENDEPAEGCLLGGGSTTSK